MLFRSPALTWTTPLPPLLFLTVTADLLPTALGARLQEALSAFPEGQRPTVIELRQQRSSAVPLDEGEVAPSLQDLDPEGVFDTLLRARGVEDVHALQRAFARLLSAQADELDSLAAPAPRPPQADA